MRELKMNIEEVDREFEDLQKGDQESQEAEGLIDVAIKEGQKIREANDVRTNRV